MYVFDHDCNELGKYNFKWTDNSKGKWLCTNASNLPGDCTVTWSWYTHMYCTLYTSWHAGNLEQAVR